MLTVNIHDAKTRLSELIARAVAGEPFIIANRGKPMVKVEALEPAEMTKPNPIGFAKGLWTMPSVEAWAEMDREIVQMFEDEMERDGGALPAADKAA